MILSSTVSHSQQIDFQFFVWFSINDKSFTHNPMNAKKRNENQKRESLGQKKRALDFELPVSVARTLNKNRTQSTIKMDQMDDLGIRAILFRDNSRLFFFGVEHQLILSFVRVTK